MNGKIGFVCESLYDMMFSGWSDSDLNRSWSSRPSSSRDEHVSVGTKPYRFVLAARKPLWMSFEYFVHLGDGQVQTSASSLVPKDSCLIG